MDILFQINETIEDTINEHKREISDVLQVITDKQLDTRKPVTDPTTGENFPSPIHAIIASNGDSGAATLLEILKLLISAGFDINEIDDTKESASCLYRAIIHGQFDFVRLLIKHSAMCLCDDDPTSAGDQYSYTMNVLARQHNVPLDLFDTLAPREASGLTEPLCEALSAGLVKTALHLLKLGANVNRVDRFLKLPIWYYFKTDVNRTSFHLLLKVLPLRMPSGVPGYLTLLCYVLNIGSSNNILELLHQLIQRLICKHKLIIKIDMSSYQTITLTVDGNSIVTDEHQFDSSKLVYLCSLVLCKLQMNVLFLVSSFRDTLLFQASEEPFIKEACKLWISFLYHQANSVKSLERLCILQIRNSMNRVDDNSFLSMPVPILIRRFLTYRDVSETIYDKLVQIQHQDD